MQESHYPSTHVNIFIFGTRLADANMCGICKIYNFLGKFGPQKNVLVFHLKCLQKLGKEFAKRIMIRLQRCDENPIRRAHLNLAYVNISRLQLIVDIPVNFVNPVSVASQLCEVCIGYFFY